MLQRTLSCHPPIPTHNDPCSHTHRPTRLSSLLGPPSKARPQSKLRRWLASGLFCLCCFSIKLWFGDDGGSFIKAQLRWSQEIRCGGYYTPQTVVRRNKGPYAKAPTSSLPSLPTPSFFASLPSSELCVYYVRGVHRRRAVWLSGRPAGWLA